MTSGVRFRKDPVKLLRDFGVPIGLTWRQLDPDQQDRVAVVMKLVGGRSVNGTCGWWGTLRASVAAKTKGPLPTHAPIRKKASQLYRPTPVTILDD